MKLHIIRILLFFFIIGCASKEDIYYLQDAKNNAVGNIIYDTSQIQPNDILKIAVESSEPSAVIPIIEEVRDLHSKLYKSCS